MVALRFLENLCTFENNSCMSMLLVHMLFEFREVACEKHTGLHIQTVPYADGISICTTASLHNFVVGLCLAYRCVLVRNFRPSHYHTIYCY
jgi:hypothetical protein